MDDKQISRWLKKNANIVEESGIIRIGIEKRIPFDINQFVQWMLNQKVRVFISLYNYNEEVGLTLDKRKLEIDMPEDEENKVITLKRKNIIDELKKQHIDEYLNTKFFTEEASSNLRRENKKLINISIRNIRKSNVIWEGYKCVDDNFRDVLALQVSDVRVVNMDFTLEAISYSVGIKNIANVIINKTNYISQMRLVFNRTFAFHSYVVVMQNIKLNINISEIDRKEILITVAASAYLIPNEEYYKSIGYYITEIDNICRQKDNIERKLKVIAVKLGYENSELTCESLLNYVYTLKWTDFEHSLGT